MPTLLPSLDEVHKEILSWSYYQLEADEGKDVKGIRKVPNTFASTDEYLEVFEPLLMQECKSQIVRAKEEADEPHLLRLASAEKVQAFVYARFEVPWESEQKFANNDLVLVSREEPGKVQKVHVIGLVESEASQLLELRLFLRHNDERCRAVAASLAFNSLWYVTRLANMVTINREYQSLHAIRELPLGPLILDPVAVPTSASAPLHIPSLMFDRLVETYNQSQLDAMQAALKRKGFTLIQGPPGTGKTKTILGLLSVLLNSTTVKNRALASDPDGAGFVAPPPLSDAEREAALRQRRAKWARAMPWMQPDYEPPGPDYGPEDFSEGVAACYPRAPQTDKVIELATGGATERPRHILVCAPSNAAIDEIVIRLLEVGLFNADGLLYTPNVIRVGPNYHPLLKNVALDNVLQMRLTSGAGEQNADMLRLQILNEASIVATTLSGSGATLFSQIAHAFDTVLLDEAGQAVELSTLIPLKYGCERCIMVGDPNQLPATVFSTVAKEYMYERSLFKRFQDSSFKVWMLRTQYRMHPEISKFPSRAFYDGILEDGPNMAATNAQPFHKFRAFRPYLFYDMVSQQKTGATSSYYNADEAYFATLLYRNLAKIAKDPNLPRRVGVITPYKQQVAELKKQFGKFLGPEVAEQIDINTVDGFQGREKDIILFSCVRSHAKNKRIGFLADLRRMNVGITRARQSLFVVGNAQQLMHNEQWSKFVQDAAERDCYIEVEKPLKTFFQRIMAADPAAADVQLGAEGAGDEDAAPEARSAVRGLGDAEAEGEAAGGEADAAMPDAPTEPSLIDLDAKATGGKRPPEPASSVGMGAAGISRPSVAQAGVALASANIAEQVAEETRRAVGEGSVVVAEGPARVVATVPQPRDEGGVLSLLPALIALLKIHRFSAPRIRAEGSAEGVHLTFSYQPREPHPAASCPCERRFTVTIRPGRPDETWTLAWEKDGWGDDAADFATAPVLFRAFALIASGAGDAMSLPRLLPPEHLRELADCAEQLAPPPRLECYDLRRPPPVDEGDLFVPSEALRERLHPPPAGGEAAVTGEGRLAARLPAPAGFPVAALARLLGLLQPWWRAPDPADFLLPAPAPGPSTPAFALPLPAFTRACLLYPPGALGPQAPPPPSLQFESLGPVHPSDADALVGFLAAAPWGTPCEHFVDPRASPGAARVAVPDHELEPHLNDAMRLLRDAANEGGGAALLFVRQLAAERGASLRATEAGKLEGAVRAGLRGAFPGLDPAGRASLPDLLSALRAEPRGSQRRRAFYTVQEFLSRAGLGAVRVPDGQAAPDGFGAAFLEAAPAPVPIEKDDDEEEEEVLDEEGYYDEEEEGYGGMDVAAQLGAHMAEFRDLFSGTLDRATAAGLRAGGDPEEGEEEWRGGGEAEAGGGGEGPRGSDPKQWGGKVKLEPEECQQRLESVGAIVYAPAPPGPAGGGIDWGEFRGYAGVKNQIEESLVSVFQDAPLVRRIAKKTRGGAGGPAVPRAVLFQVIVFIDEIDTLVVGRERSAEASHGTEGRMLSVLLRQLDGFESAESDCALTLVGATNRREDLDEAMQSRFEVVVEFGAPGEEDRGEILREYARHLAGEEVAGLARAAEGLSGRNLRDAALRRRREAGRECLDSGPGADPLDGPISELAVEDPEDGTPLPSARLYRWALDETRAKERLAGAEGARGSAPRRRLGPGTFTA
eukprot:tig00000655_g2858.t1